jgi:hypothetical protein
MIERLREPESNMWLLRVRGLRCVGLRQSEVRQSFFVDEVDAVDDVDGLKML